MGNLDSTIRLFELRKLQPAFEGRLSGHPALHQQTDFLFKTLTINREMTLFMINFSLRVVKDVLAKSLSKVTLAF